MNKRKCVLGVLKSEEELHEFYKKLRNGAFYDPIQEIAEYKNVTLPRY